MSGFIDKAENTPAIFDERVFIPTSEGMLAGELRYDPLNGACDAVMLLSPHPNFAGTMDNNVISALARQFGGQGLAVLRFNYPGVGTSTIHLPENESSFDFWDTVEKNQRFEKALGPSREALGFLKASLGTCLKKIHLAGYSFGGLIALMMAAEAPEIQSVTAISMPWIQRYDYGFLEQVRRPKYFISGNRDFAFEQKVFDRVWPKIPEPKEFHAVDNDHFFRKSENRLAEMVGRLLETAGSTAAPRNPGR